MLPEKDIAQSYQRFLDTDIEVAGSTAAQVNGTDSKLRLCLQAEGQQLPAHLAQVRNNANPSAYSEHTGQGARLLCLLAG